MNRVKEIQDKEKAPSLNVEASKRFVKSALWKAAQSKQPVESEGIVFPNLAYNPLYNDPVCSKLSLTLK